MGANSMILIAIANISNGKETIGFRLLDVENEQIKDVNLNDIASALNSGAISIDNLSIEQSIITGSNGSINRLPKIINKLLEGKSPLIVLNQLGNIGYEVSDYKGTILNVKNEDIIEYAKSNGISNGKIVTQNGNEFISAIKGNYTIKDMGQVKNRTLYTGSLDTSTAPLKPILNQVNSMYGYNTNHTLISYFNGSILVDNNHNNTIDIEEIEKGLMYECGGYTLARVITVRLKLNKNKHIERIKQLIRIKEFRADIDNLLVGYSNRGVSSYDLIGSTNDILGGVTRYDNIAVDEVEKYFKALKTLRAKIYNKLIIQSKKLALSRVCKQNGITYKVCDFGEVHGSGTININLEDIYHYSKEYDNVIVNGKELKIVGLDGTYIYNMDMIQKTYQRSIVESNRSIKASIVDPMYQEGINELGELKRFRSSHSLVVIPKTVQTIYPSSITLLKNNTDIIFGDHIKKCSKRCFDPVQNAGSNSKGIKYVEIGCKSTASDIIDALDRVYYVLSPDLELHFNYDIYPGMYVKIMYSEIPAKKITSKNRLDDIFILSIIKSVINGKLGKLEILKSPIQITTYPHHQLEPEAVLAFHRFVNKLRILQTEWKNKLEPVASDETKIIVYGVLNKISEQLSFRDKELKENISKMKKASGK